MFNKSTTELADPESDELTDITVIIIDRCSYSRMACEEIVSDITGVRQYYSFECFTDYKLWSEGSGNVLKNRYIVFNAATGPYYDIDVVEFLAYFNAPQRWAYDQENSECRDKNQENVAGNDNILLLVPRSRPLLYRNAIITHYMAKNNLSSSLVVVSDFAEMDIFSVKELLFGFILRTLKTGNLSKIRPYFTNSDLRAMNILLSGDNISAASSRYRVAAKTLYTQCTSVLDKLAF